MATGGSTNAVLHYLAIAAAAGVKWSIDDFERIRRKVPVLCNLKPSGPYVATDFHAAGGVPQVLKMLLAHGLVHGECLTITGRTLTEELANVPEEPGPARMSSAPGRIPYTPRGTCDPQGQSRHRSCVAKITGLKQTSIQGPARVFDSEPAAMAAILARKSRRRRDRDPLRRTERRPWHAGDAGAHFRAHRPGLGRIGRPRHRWPLFGRHLGPGRRGTSRRRPTWAGRSRW